jgi:tetrahydromethanopterin S-methyltransferase subunit E
VGFNWQGTLADYAQTSGVLAGFCLALIVFVLGWNVANAPLCDGITYGQISVCLIGIALGLYVAATEFFLTAKGFDLWTLPDEYRKTLIKKSRVGDMQWLEARETIDGFSRTYNAYGTICYNVAMFLVFFGMLFIVAPFSLTIASLITAFGVGLEILQIWHVKRIMR